MAYLSGGDHRRALGRPDPVPAQRRPDRDGQLGRAGDRGRSRHLHARRTRGRPRQKRPGTVYRLMCGRPIPNPRSQ